MDSQLHLPSFSAILDNYYRGHIGDFIKSHIQTESKLSFVSAYFTVFAYDAIQDCLNDISELRFLFGEPKFIKSIDPSKFQTKQFRIENDELKLANRLEQKRVSRECAEWVRQKVRIKSVKQAGLLHGKMYHLSHNGIEDAVVGSSNFTVSGLGLGKSGNNIEINLVVNDARDKADLKAWFDHIWDDDSLVQDVKDEVLFYLEQLYKNQSPEFVYFKTLFHLFERFLDDAQWQDAQLSQTTLLESGIWKALFDFQKDGVKGAINKIRSFNGCILADSVGLGKTYEALAVIKYFELRNERVLVLCPKRLRENWTVYRNNDALNPFVADRFRYDVLCHTDLSRDGGISGDINLETLNWGNYDLVVIDESHNFRNNSKGKRDSDGNVIRKSRYERLMDDIIKAGVRTKVLLLSATPVNNDLKDLRNQLYILTEGRDDAFKDDIGVASLQETLRQAQMQFSLWAKKKSEERKTSELLERLSSAFFKLLDQLTIARSRRHIHRYYKESVVALGGFPKRLKPISVFSEIDLEEKFLSYDRLNDEISNYRLTLFNPSRYLFPQFLPEYEKAGQGNFTQLQRETFLIGMMKVNFLKRLESSVKSFEISMQRTIEKIERLEDKIRRFQETRKQEEGISPNTFLESETEDEEIRDTLEVGGKLTFRLEHLDLTKWMEDLQDDRRQLNLLLLQAKDVSINRDAKLLKLKTRILSKIDKPTIDKHQRHNRKLLVFTAFADTAQYLFEAIQPWLQNERPGIHIALVTGDSSRNRTTFGEQSYGHILTNFAPFAKKRDKMKTMPQDGEIDILIATDCISEGQNLQDCDEVINYDIHWNPVRIIQRFGRIDRIGSPNTAVQLVNFWPTPHLEKYISLKHRVESRMALADIAATFEENLLQPQEIEELIKGDLKYRDKQLLRLKDEILDLEEFSETVSLNEFTLDDFRVELLNYLESNRRALEDAPFGLYAVVPPHQEMKAIAPGVVFCFRDGKSDSRAAANEKINPMQPYFLVYVLNDGNVRFTFAQPKQILEVFRLLCGGKPAADEKLCDLFDKETDNGGDMSKYQNLLEKAFASIAHTVQKRAISGLQNDRGFVLPKKTKAADPTEGFELITWLAIKGSEVTTT